MLNLDIYGSAKPFEWTHEHLNRVLSTGSNPVLKDPIIINAFRAIDRINFTPEEKQHLAYLDKSVPVGYEEQMASPSTVGRLLEAVKPQYGGNYLHLGTNTGYLGSILGFIAGKHGRVYSLERILWLWEKARKNLKKYPQLNNTAFLFRDGQFGLEDKGPYDGIIISYSLPGIPKALVEQLKPGGRMVVPHPDYSLKVIEKTNNNEIIEDIQVGFMLEPGKVGIA